MIAWLRSVNLILPPFTHHQVYALLINIVIRDAFDAMLQSVCDVAARCKLRGYSRASNRHAARPSSFLTPYSLVFPTCPSYITPTERVTQRGTVFQIAYRNPQRQAYN